MASIKPVYINASGSETQAGTGDFVPAAHGGTGLSTLTANSYLRALSSSAFELRTAAQVLSDIGALAASAYTAADVLAKLITVDGASSGLDADLLDGQQGSYYLAAANITGYFTNGIGIDGAAATARRMQIRTGGVLRWDFGGDGTAESGSDVGTNFVINHYDDAGVSLGAAIYIERNSGATTVKTLTVTGAASGILTASPTWQWRTETSVRRWRAQYNASDATDGAFNFEKWNGSAWITKFSVDTSDVFRVGGNAVWHEGNLTPANYVPTTLSIIAGNGLTGGGALSANRTLTLGTPGTITGSTTNSVTATSHTHALTTFTLTFGNGLVNGTYDPAGAAATATLGTPSTLTAETTNGVTATSHTHAMQLQYLYNDDDRSGVIRTTPDTYRDRGLSVAFNSGTNVGLGSTYAMTLHLAPWTVFNAAYKQQQLGFRGDAAGFYWRAATSDTVWGPWYQVHTEASTNIDAATLGGVAESEANAGSTIVKRTAAGYINSSYINTTANVTAAAASHIWVETGSDSYHRKQTPAQFLTNHGVALLDGASFTGSSIICDGWWRSTGNTGWHNNTYGGGIYMTDTSWVRVYGSKGFLVSGASTTGSNGDIQISSISPTIRFYDTDQATAHWIHCNSNQIGFLASNAYSWSSYRDASNNWVTGGNLTAYASDRRLKTNIVDVPEDIVEHYFNTVQIRLFDWDKEKLDHYKISFEAKLGEVGAIAQEMMDAFADAVRVNPAHNPIKTDALPNPPKYDILTIDWTKTIPLLTAEVQRLRKRVSELEKRV